MQAATARWPEITYMRIDARTFSKNGEFRCMKADFMSIEAFLDKNLTLCWQNLAEFFNYCLFFFKWHDLSAIFIQMYEKCEE